MQDESNQYDFCWNLIEPFSVWGTRFPIEWITNLAIPELYFLIRDNISIETELTLIVQKLSDFLKEKNLDRDEQKNLKKIEKKMSLFSAWETGWLAPLSRRISNDQLEGLVKHYQGLQSKLTLQRAKAKSLFETEFPKKRANLWTLAQKPEVQMAIFEMSPDFLSRLEETIDHHDLKVRNSELKRRENTLFSYLTRFCSKNAVGGIASPVAKGTFNVAQSDSAELPNTTRPESFFSHWACYELAHAMLKDRDLVCSLPVSMNSMIYIDKDTLRSRLWKNNDPYLPRLESQSMDQNLLDFVLSVKSDRSGSVDSILNSMMREDSSIKKHILREKCFDLVNKNILSVGLQIPPGVFQPLEYLRDLLKLSDSSIEKTHSPWVAILEEFEGYRSDFATADLALKKKILRTTEEKFFELTHSSSKRGAGENYADRFILYVDYPRSPLSISFSSLMKEKLLTDYTAALELLAPDWFLRILPIVVTCKEIVQKLKDAGKQSIDDKAVSHLVESLQNVFSVKLNDLLKTQIYKKILEDLIALKSMRDKVLACNDSHDSVFAIDLNLLNRYRAELKKFLRNEVLIIPLYASGPIVQIGKNETEFLVFDSVVMGNCMNLSILNFFVEPRCDTLKKLETCFKKIYKTNVDILLHFTQTAMQRNRYTPHLTPGVDVEFLGPSMKEAWLTLENLKKIETQKENGHQTIEWQSKKKTFDFIIPNNIRLSSKLIKSDFLKHCPRIQFGETVLQRARWRLSVDELLSDHKGVSSKDPYEKYETWVRLQKELSIPRFIFVEAGTTEKNIMVDFANPLSIEILSSMLKSGLTLEVSEMLPSPEHFWKKSEDDLGHVSLGLMPFLYMSQQ